MLAICTRTKNEDYEFKGDVNAYNKFKERINQFNFLYDTTKPLAILDGKDLFIAGIVTGRKDKVNTVIRYSLFYSGEKSSALFSRFREALKRDQAKKLGDRLDTLLILNNEESVNFTVPHEETFLRFLDAALPESNPKQICDFAIWTVFCPSERSDQAFESFLLSKHNALPHHGIIEVESLTPQNFSALAQKKTTQTGRSMVKNALILLCGICLGVLGANFAEMYVKPSDLANMPPQPIEIQTQPAEVEKIPQATGMLILMENQQGELPALLKEKSLQEMPNHKKMHLQIPFAETDKAVILIPVYSTTRVENPLPEKTIIRQLGPAYLTLWEEKQKAETISPSKAQPAVGAQEVQKTPETKEVPSKKANQKSRLQKNKKN